MISNPDDYQGFDLQTDNLLFQLCNCLILCLISTQAEIYNTDGYKKFITGVGRKDEITGVSNEDIILAANSGNNSKDKNKDEKASGMQVLMEIADIKREIMELEFNNNKMRKIISIQKNQQQILRTVERIKLNCFLWRKQQQRALI